MTTMPPVVDGILVIDKPAGLTSHDVVARIRRRAGTRRVGHAGTLDPMATGVLICGLDRGTRLLGHLTAHDKSYDATIRLGVTTSTDDAAGDVVARADASAVSDNAVQAAIRGFVGTIDQVPAAVSAVKVDGRRAYARVRAGEEVTLPPRRVVVRRFDLLDRRGDELDVRVDCSAGTYVRALARDVGAVLGVGAHLTALRRTRSGAFSLDEAVALDAVERSGGPLPLLSLGTVATRCFPRWDVDDVTARRLALGQRLPPAGLPSGSVAAIDPAGALVALVEERDDAIRPAAVFSADPRDT